VCYGHGGACRARFNGKVVVPELAINATEAPVGPDGSPRYLVGGERPLVLPRLFNDGTKPATKLPASPAGRDPDTDTEGGRDLFLVAALPRQWAGARCPAASCIWTALTADGG
jgi:hypothetical protein